MATAMVLFACTVIVLSSATTYNNWKVSSRRVSDGLRVKAMRDRDPYICSIDYMVEGCNRGVLEAGKQPFVDAIIQTIVDSVVYKIYNIHPHYVWWALFAMIVLLTFSEYKLRSERIITRNMAANGMAVMTAAAAAAMNQPRIDENMLNAAVGKALRQQTRAERREQRQQQQQSSGGGDNDDQPKKPVIRFADAPTIVPIPRSITTSALAAKMGGGGGDHISAHTTHKSTTSNAIHIARLADEVDA